MRLFLFITGIFSLLIGNGYFSSSFAAELLLETDSFQNKGGWVLDTQFSDQMGSFYLMAHGLGIPVEDAVTPLYFKKSGNYTIYVRTYNWTSPWFDGKGPGKFQIGINGIFFDTILGDTGKQWEWQVVGNCSIKSGENRISLHDLTGFNARCDAIYFSTEATLPPANINQLSLFRKKLLPHTRHSSSAGNYDLVVVGGGIAGMSTAVAAARLGLKVALIQNRPRLGGNNSSDVRVHLGGRIEAKPYTHLGDLQKEFGPTKEGNAMSADNYEDQKKMDFILAEKNIKLFLNWHVFSIEKRKGRIKSVIARNTETGEEMHWKAPIFADCTGDGTVGFLAGADFRMGREAKSEFNESLAPEKADEMTLGASVQWYSKKDSEESTFPVFEYGIIFNQENSEKVLKGEWTWETGMNRNQIADAERIRDYGMLVIFSNWSYLKNKFPSGDYKKHSLSWVAYIAGKRESRRLLGDHILTENDIIQHRIYEDAAGTTTWSIDLHYPDPKNSQFFPNEEFKAIARQNNIHPYPVPYRCLYSRNIPNLFMAGRDISVTHVALGTTRVMRTCGILGEVVGMASSLCKKYHCEPRDIYLFHLEELKEIMKQGVSPAPLPNNQTYNLGGTLGEWK